MKHFKYFFFIIFQILPAIALACPNCAGSSNAKDKYTVVILGIFILLTYIPFYILFNLTKRSKMKNMNGSAVIDVSAKEKS
jgi:uncharacterized membrane protein